mgnify:CR=1 FL=1
MNNVLIIGGGIHGIFTSIYLKKKFPRASVDIIEKKKNLMNGSSFATHNRANKGYHYPRSTKTANECKKGWEYFNKKYSDCFENISNSYYIIEKTSKTSFNSFYKFLKENKYDFKVKNPPNMSLNKKFITGSFEVFEGCFDHVKLTKKTIKLIKKYKINTFQNFEFDKLIKNKNNFVIISKLKKKITRKYDLIINCTYSDINHVLKKFGIRERKNLYKTQYTFIPVVKTKKKIPGLTVIDGPYLTIMPYSSKKNHYLLYDVINSISKKPISKQNKLYRYKRMLKRFNKYFPDDHNFKLVDFLDGTRPIPKKNTGDRRSTIIQKNMKFGVPIYSIREGKYISAPYIAKEFVNKL